MKKRLLAALEGVLTLLVAGLLGLLLMTASVVAYWIIIEGRTYAEIPWPLAAPGSETVVVEPGTIAVLIIALSIQAAVFGAVGLGMGRWRVKAEGSRPVFNVPATLAIAFTGGVAAILGTVVLSALLTLLGLEIEEQPWVLALAQSDPRSLWMLVPWTVVVGPVAEEVFFRYYLFRFFAQHIGVGFGYAASAVMFAVVHFHPPALPLYLFYGLLLAWIYRRTSRLLAPVVVHMFINLVSTVTLVLTAAELSAG